MRTHVLLCGLPGGLVIAGLQFIEYRRLVVEYSVEISGALVAVVFAAFGRRLVLRFTRPARHKRHKETLWVREVEAPAEFVRDRARLRAGSSRLKG
jgi:hypothetical protein